MFACAGTRTHDLLGSMSAASPLCYEFSIYIADVQFFDLILSFSNTIRTIWLKIEPTFDQCKVFHQTSTSFLSAPGNSFEIIARTRANLWTPHKSFHFQFPTIISCSTWCWLFSGCLVFDRLCWVGLPPWELFFYFVDNLQCLNFPVRLAIQIVTSKKEILFCLPAVILRKPNRFCNRLKICKNLAPAGCEAAPCNYLYRLIRRPNH